jgi:hypothetical protein
MPILPSICDKVKRTDFAVSISALKMEYSRTARPITKAATEGMAKNKAMCPSFGNMSLRVSGVTLGFTWASFLLSRSMPAIRTIGRRKKAGIKARDLAITVKPMISSEGAKSVALAPEIWSLLQNFQ